MTVLWTLTPEQIRGTWDHPDVRESLCQWARDNGIDPADISVAGPVTVERDGNAQIIRYRQPVRDEHGHTQADPDAALQIITAEVTVPLRVDPPTLPTTQGGTDG